MFEERQDFADAVEKLMAVSFDVGQVLAYDVITDVTGYERDTYEFRYVLKKFRERVLAERKIPTRCVNNVGVHFLDSKHAMEAVADRGVRAGRQLRRGKKESVGVKLADLSAHDRRRFTQLQEASSNTLKQLQNETRVFRTEATLVRTGADKVADKET